MRFRSPVGVLAFAVACLMAIVPLPASAQGWLGFEIWTKADDTEIPEDTVIVRYEGEIVFPMAENVVEIGKSLAGRYKTIVLDLDSAGGQLDHAARVADALEALRRQAALHTRVRNGQKCLSACVIVYMQGAERSAGSASTWLFHGPCPKYTNVPTPEGTRRYVDMLRKAGVGDTFLCELIDHRYLAQPGKFWLSGYELFHREGAGVITTLLPGWQPEAPIMPPFDPSLRSR